MRNNSSYGVPTFRNPANFIGKEPLADWQGDNVPFAIRQPIESWQHAVDIDTGVSSWNQMIADFAGSFPIFGGLLKGIANMTGVNLSNRNLVKAQNQLQQAYARYQNWYNSPAQQLKRLRAAGLNPFMQSYVKSYPAADAHFENYVPVSYGPSTFAADLNALTNYELARHKSDNLDSLTAVNQYKLDNLLPQLFDKNGYINSILGLESDWAKENYNYEHTLEQKILETRYTYALAQLGEEIMKLQPMHPNARTIVNPNEGTVTYVDTETGEKLDLSNMPLSQWPIYLQEAYTNMFLSMARANDANAHASLNNAMQSTQSALACLYNWQGERVKRDVDAYDKTGVWATDDPLMRWAAGLISDDTQAYKAVYSLFFDDNPYSKLLRAYFTR